METEVERDGRTNRERRFFIGSLLLDADPFARAVRQHWRGADDEHSLEMRRRSAAWDDVRLEATVRQAP